MEILLGGSLRVSCGRLRGGPTVQLPRVKSLEDLNALAIILERRAAERFRLLAAAMAARGRMELSELFKQLAQEEARHEAALRQAAPALDDGALEGRWPDELGEAPRQPDASQLAGASVYQCLADAVRNEEKAFRFFSYVAANSKDEALRSRAETLAKEELAHAALLRQARRTAYHRQKRLTQLWPNGRKVTTMAELRRSAVARELALQQRLEALPLEVTTARALEHAAKRIRALLAPEPEHSAAERTDPPPSSPEDTCAAAFEFYDQVARAARDEALMLCAQSLSEIALERIVLLADQGEGSTGP